MNSVNSKSVHIVRGALLSPLVSPFVMSVFTGLSLGSCDTCTSRSAGDFFQFFLIVLVISLPISYAVIFVIGLPLIKFLNKINMLNGISIVCFSFILGGITSAVFWRMLSSSLEESTRSTDYGFYILQSFVGAINGGILAAVFCLISGIHFISKTNLK